MSRIFRTERPLLERDSHLYVERAEDARIAGAIKRGDYVVLTGARQTGKTSLLLRLRRQLLEEGHLPIYLDCSPTRDGDEEAWYGHLRGAMMARLPTNNLRAPLPRMRDHLDLRDALRQLSLELCPRKQMVILIDAVSALPRDIAEHFFGVVRTVFNERQTFPTLQRYIFVLAGAFIPGELARDQPSSSLNVASLIYTTDADRQGLARLVRNLERVGHAVSDEIVGRIYDWTGGHVYLTQRLCSILERRGGRSLTCELVDHAVNDVLDDRSIRRICDELKALPEEEQVFQRILAAEDPLRFNRASRTVADLELIGLIKSDAEGYCTVRNAIYRKAMANGIERSGAEDFSNGIRFC